MKTAFAFLVSFQLVGRALSFSAMVQEVDVAKAFAESKFPIAPEDLITRAKVFLSDEVGGGVGDGGECLADNFQFCGPVVGPLGRDEYLNALRDFKLTENFETNPNLFGFTVSPLQTNRVYWFGYSEAKLIAPFFGAKPEDVTEDIILPPQVFHMDFNEEGKVTKFGFATADRTYGNTGGVGGVYGYFYGIGKALPFPEARPFKPSLRYALFMKFARLLERLKGKKK